MGPVRVVTQPEVLTKLVEGRLSGLSTSWPLTLFFDKPAAAPALIAKERSGIMLYNVDTHRPSTGQAHPVGSPGFRGPSGLKRRQVEVSRWERTYLPYLRRSPSVDRLKHRSMLIKMFEI
jgi:hypothetical protein